MKWDEQPLNGLLEINRQSIDSGFPYTEIEYIDTSSANEGRLDGVQKLKLTEAPSRAKRIVADNSILYSTVRPNLRHFAFVEKSKPNLIASTGFAVIECKDGLEPKFLYSLLTTNSVIDYLMSIAEGQSSTFPAFNPEAIEKLKVKLPPLPVQRRIAEVLGRYDELIENYNRQIAILESTAQNIYREWFVRGRCPNTVYEEGTRMPIGWGLRQLRSFGKIITGKTPSTSVVENFGGNVPFIKTPDMHGNMFLVDSEETLTDEGADSQRSQSLPQNSICVSCIGTAGIVGITASVVSQTNQQINSIVLDDLRTREYLYFAVKDLKDIIELYGSTGATMANLSKGKLEQLKVVFPPDNILSRFHYETYPLFEKVKNLSFQLLSLRRMRDKLLSRLLSGKLPVNVVGN